jgi:hypothetical protein
VRTLMAGEGVLLTMLAESAVFGGDGEAGLRLRRTVMLRIKSVFQSRCGSPASTCRKSWPTCAPAVAGSCISWKKGMRRSVGVASSSL